jgi:hypothetical protein
LKRHENKQNYFLQQQVKGQQQLQAVSVPCDTLRHHTEAKLLFSPVHLFRVT